ncbi:PREDICTED: EG45-like domain containing protein isoform X2 [Nicotiana attenuata]|uniref:EG45-like domain containing protein isoform X2 n=1 Tax=Nicotiana attenuata TaxID=49451 RepID=UPI0009056311|nr:PREDICTED: EG45-like domain containing protein isoform X2 [Nicotiana attenuata]
MSKPLPLLLQWLSLFLIFSQLLYASQADLGTASQYSPPYTPSACFGSDSTQFPSSNFFAAAGEGIWDDGAACGRQYLISCISSILPRACKSGETIQIKIVDRAQTVASNPTRQGTTIVLSNAAFAAIADSNALSLNIDFQQI